MRSRKPETEIRHLIRDRRRAHHDLAQAALDTRQDPLQRANAVKLRKRSQEAVLKVSAQMERDPLIKADPALAREFRRRFSELRSRIAVFQAKWPAVLLSEADPAFIGSAAEMRSYNKTFDDWVSANLDVDLS